ncbi:hypothetical protein X736_31925 [Mesorhizobium sp. L2C089B000]|nr:hypothetical protein X736_31925 [Mesorhizobium sp. L2C089B000]
MTDKDRRRIYLDHPAGTQVPQAVTDAASRCLLTQAPISAASSKRRSQPRL